MSLPGSSRESARGIGGNVRFVLAYALTVGRSWRVVVSVAGLVASGSLLVGCTSDAPAPRPAARSTARPSATATPLSAYDSRGVVVARADLCPLLTRSTVERALGGAVTDQSSYGDGDTAQVSPQLRDRVAEFGCTYADTGLTTMARAWVFAPPVTRGRARTLVRDAGAQAGCQAIPDAPAFGSPSVGTVCRGPVTGFSSRPGPDRTTVTYAGLFGDAWLSCSVTDSVDVPVAAIRTRAGDWCVAVASAGDTATP